MAAIHYPVDLAVDGTIEGMRKGSMTDIVEQPGQTSQLQIVVTGTDCPAALGTLEVAISGHEAFQQMGHIFAS